jgi:hypothetical protein
MKTLFNYISFLHDFVIFVMLYFSFIPMKTQFKTQFNYIFFLYDFVMLVQQCHRIIFIILFL